MTRHLRASSVTLIIGAATVILASCITGNSPSSGNFTIFTSEKVTFTGLQGGTYTSPVAVSIRAQSYSPYGPNLIGTLYNFTGETGIGGIYRALNAVVPARWSVDQTSGPCETVPGAITSGQIHLGEAYNSVCVYTKHVVGLINASGDGILFNGGCCNTNTLTSGMSLTEGQTITSQDGQYVLVYQGDGNFVLYRWSDGVPMWNSITEGTSAGTVIMQSDGNLVVYDAGQSPVWNAGTYGHSGAYARLENGGNLVVYSTAGTVLWSSRGAGGGGTGRWKVDGHGGCFWAAYDSGPNQCFP